MPQPTNRQHRYIASLDGLRAIAVLAVIAYHLNLPFAPGGLLGVGVFFVLSGYLITDLLMAEWRNKRRIDLTGFWMRRARRLLPGMLAMLVLVIAWMTVWHRTQLPTVRSDAIAAALYVSNWWLIFHHVSYFQSFGMPSPLGHLWSLAVEEQFYLLWPFLLLLGLFVFRRRGRLAGATLVLALLSALWMAVLYQPGMDPSRVYYGTDTRAFALLIGAALAMVWPSDKLSDRLPTGHRTVLDGIGCVGLAGIVFAMAGTSEYSPFLYDGGMVLVAVATALLIAAIVHPDSWLGRALGLGPLRWLGVRSYGIYLWHYPVIVLTSPVVNTGGIHPWRCAAQAAASILLAALSWRWLEDPIRRGEWAKRWPSRPSSSRRAKRRRPWLVTSGASVVMGLFCVGMVMPTPKSKNVQPMAASATSGATPSSPSNRPTPSAQPSPRNLIPDAVDTTASNHGASPDASNPPASSGVSRHTSSGNLRVSAVGDSIMVDVTPNLQKLVPGIVIDGKVGRQLYQAPPVLAQWRADGKLGNIVVIELGTNGPFSQQQMTSLLAEAGDANVILVNTRVPRPWQDVVNQALASVARKRPHTELVDWYRASAGHAEYFAPDGVHLTLAGARVYANLVATAIHNFETSSGQ
ncbi:acyltransferase [Alicyclobacillus contaminans]|uniref:acyltransferase family protein n=1 Tax=Alicyclobacillus contaminans TaxID=392016 RepID=UPI000425E33A|nr:acyltransferase family protein [Alicyclobacillus contaminans]GMA51201.1 acyltransferase [Alicyclobacillus contaminans]